MAHELQADPHHALEKVPLHPVLEKTTSQLGVYRRALLSKVPAEIVRYIESMVDLSDAEHLAILETSSPLNLINFGNNNNVDGGSLDGIINVKRINDMRYVNKFFESANQKLRNKGLLIGCVETSQQREQRIMAKRFYPLNVLMLFFDYWIKRVWPKLPYLKQYYFLLTAGRNRVISEIETYGRLYSCGFRLVATMNAAGNLYFVAEKIGAPDYNMQATYGPLIKLNRIGKGGKHIKVNKFRTMYPYSEYLQQYMYERYGLQSGGKIKSDPRVNRMGKFLRKFWLDELPMLLNLMRGDLKIIGVRPLSKQYLSLYPEAFQAYRSQFKPGLIPPFYADLPKTFDEIVASEERYLAAYERQGIITDFKYFFKAIYNIVIKRARSH